MRKFMITMIAAATAVTVVTGCQARPAQDATQGTVQETTQEPTTAREVKLEDVYTAVKEAYGDQYIPSMEYDEQLMTDLFGISPEMYVSYIAEGPMISVHVDQFIAVEAREGKGEEVETLLNEYRDSQLNDALQYPMNLPKIEASEVVRHGDYVFFVMLGAMDQEAADEAEALEAAKESNRIGVDVINGFFQ